MGNLTMGVALLLLAGVLWTIGAVLHWYNIRRQERLIERLHRLAGRRRRRVMEAAELALPVAPQSEYLRPAKRWTVD